MPTLPAATRRANRWLLAALIFFAVALTVIVFLWMQRVVRANGGIADPQRKKSTSLTVPDRKPAVRADGEGRSQKAEGRSPDGRPLLSSGTSAFLRSGFSELLPSDFCLP